MHVKDVFTQVDFLLNLIRDFTVSGFLAIVYYKYMFASFLNIIEFFQESHTFTFWV